MIDTFQIADSVRLLMVVKGVNGIEFNAVARPHGSCKPNDCKADWRIEQNVGLGNAAAEHMTPALLADRDLDGEIIGWMSAIKELLAS